MSDLSGVCAARAKLFFIHPIYNGAKPVYVTGGKEIPNVDDVVTKAGRHDEFTMRGLEDLGNDDSELMNTR